MKFGFFSFLQDEVAKSEKTIEDLTIEPVKSQNQAPPAEKESSNQASNGPGKSWASLFHKDTPFNAGVGSASKPMARIQPYSNTSKDADVHEAEGQKNNSDNRQVDGASANLDINPNDLDMANFLQAYALNHRSSMIKPRGLSNRNNWCFVNAILQVTKSLLHFLDMIKFQKSFLGPSGMSAILQLDEVSTSRNHEEGFHGQNHQDYPRLRQRIFPA